jgi:tetratricopeptide (TPR) repeat protein
MFPSELERIRWSVASLDRHVADSTDHQKALLAAAKEYHGEALQLSSEVVASQERIQELLGRAVPEIQALGAEVATLAPVMEQGFEAVKEGLADLGALFQWGFDEVLCQLSLQRQDLKQILTTLQAPLDTQAKELRLRGLEALRNGWHEEALRDLLVSEQKNYRDFTVLRAVAAIYLRREHWAEARAYYEKAATYARPYSPRDAAEAHLGASVACRQQGDIASAYRHSESATGLSPSLPEAHYDHAINATCASQSPQQGLWPPAAQFLDEATTALRKVLWADEEYAVRVDTESHFGPIRGACNALLVGLCADLEREVAQALARVDAALASAEAVCGKDRFAMIGARALRARAALRRVQARNSILDYVEVRRQAPVLER